MAEQSLGRTRSERAAGKNEAATGDPTEPRVVELRGEHFLLRLIRPEDARAYSHFLARIDEADLRFRFVRPPEIWSDRDVVRYAQPDFEREVAFIAERLSRPGSGEIVGEVRAFRYPEARTAEFAIIVRSDMKRRGIGRALMKRIIEYGSMKGLELIGQIAPHNTAMIRLAERVGMDVEREAASDFAIAHMPGNG